MSEETKKEEARAKEEDTRKRLKGVKRKPPRVRAGQRGAYNSAMEMAPEAIKEQDPNVALRWVRMPPHSGDNTNAYRAAGIGFQPVDRMKYDNLPIPFDASEDSTFIRAMDMVLFEAPKEVREEERAYRRQLAEDDQKRPENTYRKNISEQAESRYVRPGGTIRTRVEDHPLRDGREE